MTKTGWKKRIKAACEQCGTYRPAFEDPITALAEILEKRDLALQGFKKSGEPMIIIFANGNSGTNSWIKLWCELNAQALRYWAELGITPAGLKKIDESAMKMQKRQGLAEALREIGI